VIGGDLFGDISLQRCHVEKYARRPRRVGRTC
jgi:hypothetical protein